jgi:hypothetical protein
MISMVGVHVVLSDTHTHTHTHIQANRQQQPPPPSTLCRGGSPYIVLSLI